MTQTLTTERMAEIAKLAIRLQQISSCAAVTSSGETVLHHTHVDEILSALHDVTAEILANRDAQPVGFYTTVSGRKGVVWHNGAPEDDTAIFTTPPAPAVPDKIEPTLEAIRAILPTANPDEYACCIGADMWNACRAAMLAQPVSSGYKLVPVEPTAEMISSAMGIPETAIAIYKRMLAAAPEGGNG